MEPNVTPRVGRPNVRRYGLTSRLLKVLKELDRPTNVRELAELTGVPGTATVASRLEALEAEGRITRVGFGTLWRVEEEPPPEPPFRL